MGGGFGPPGPPPGSAIFAPHGNRINRINEVTRQSLHPSRHAGDYRFVHQLRTRFAETDAMGIIHHAAYLPYMEEARVAYLRHLGHPYDEVRRQGFNFAVLEVAVQYRRPLLFDDVVDVHLAAGAVSRATFQLAYLLTVADEVRATAVSVHGCVDADGKAARLPVWVGETFSVSSDPEKQTEREG
jgi:acyl-CoA thioester hydrolase